MNKILRILLLPAILILITCSENPVEEEEVIERGDITSSDSIASVWFQALSDTVVALSDRDKEGIKTVQFTNIRNGFNKALSLNPRNPVAHLGLSILEILELNYSEEIWEVIDSLDAWDSSFDQNPGDPVADPPNRHPIIGNQFSLLAKIPFSMAVKRTLHFPPNVTTGRIQEIIENTIIPALDRSIAHLASVETSTKTKVEFTIDDEGVRDTVVVDLGEVYFFDASVHAARAGFEIATAYYYEFPGPDGTYDWIDAIRRLDEEDEFWLCYHYEIISGAGGDTLDLVYSGGRSDVEIDSILITVARYNVEERENFLTLKNGGQALQAAHGDILKTIEKLEASVDFIKHVRTQTTEANIIKLTDLTDLESDLEDPDLPNFAKNFNTVEDVLDWVRGFVSGPVTFTENIGPSNTSFTWTMDVSSLFDNPVQDWKELLPYHRWELPSGSWTKQSLIRYDGWENWGGWPIWEYVNVDGSCEMQMFTNIAYVRYSEYEYKLIDSQAFIEFLDSPGGSVIDLDIERFPYLPDYTLNGLFPGMTRSKWIELVNILD